EDGIRAATVTGVQTCALPIFGDRRDALHRATGRRGVWQPHSRAGGRGTRRSRSHTRGAHGADSASPRPTCELPGRARGARLTPRSEERRVGKESYEIRYT